MGKKTRCPAFMVLLLISLSGVQAEEWALWFQSWWLDPIHTVHAGVADCLLVGGGGIHGLYPPLTIRAERRENRAFFSREFLNELTWEPNPKNQGQDIRAYRIFSIARGDQSLIGRVPAGVLTFLHRGVDDSSEYTYYIAAVDSEGRSSHPNIITVR